MYLVVINVPFRRINDTAAEVASDWGSSLLLLRDSYAGRFGEVTVAAPTLPPGGGPINGQAPQRLEAESDGIRFVPLGDTRWRARAFWWNYPRIRAICRDLARRADVVHSGVGNLYQPYAWTGFRAGRAAGATTVFVQDGDAVGRLYDLARDAPLPQRLKTAAYCHLYQKVVRWSVRRADLSLLKGRAVHARYGRFARNARDFFDTSYFGRDVIPAGELAAKIARIRSGAALRCLSLGRLRDFKQVDHTIEAVAAAAGRGVPLTLDVIGDGPEAPRLQALVADLAAGDYVRLLGYRPYGPELLHALREYDLYLFTSSADETPRAVFDAFAAGAVLLAYALPYTEQVVEQTGAGRCVTRGERTALAAALEQWHANRAALAELVKKAAAAGAAHSADAWYARRALWTIAAHEERRAGTGRATISAERSS